MEYQRRNTRIPRHSQCRSSTWSSMDLQIGFWRRRKVASTVWIIYESRRLVEKLYESRWLPVAKTHVATHFEGDIGRCRTSFDFMDVQLDMAISGNYQSHVASSSSIQAHHGSQVVITSSLLKFHYQVLKGGCPRGLGFVRNPKIPSYPLPLQNM